MVFIWVDSAKNIKSPYEAKSNAGRVEKISKTAQTNPDNDTKDAKDKSFVVNQEDFHDAAEYTHAKQAYEHASKLLEKTQKQLFAKQIMSSPVKTLPHKSSLSDAISFVTKNRFRHVPIINAENTLIGIISDRDIFRYYYENKGTAVELRSITDLIKYRILTASPDTRISAVAKTLFEERIGSMPILDSNHDLVGLITRSDILRALIKEVALEKWV